MKWPVIALCAIIAGIQLIQVQRTNPEVVYDFDGPSEVKALLKRSCYDCHSNETEWPWYSHVAPASWLVDHHVEDGRKHLNFSEWEALRVMGWIRNEIVEEVAGGKMPPKSYLRMHSDAKVTAEELAILQEWAGAQGP
ncbi:MAG TPA: heme-binding domain-containing protein [Pontiella sp.]|nr:heme-binding domain-containing protein [Pontiella sp.]